MSERMAVVSVRVLFLFVASPGYKVARQRGSHIRLVKNVAAR